MDLTTGIQDAYPIPVIGILNERPHGPCINTKADINKVRRAILDFVEGPPPSNRSKKPHLDSANSRGGDTGHPPSNHP
jgi:hypothetical protein